MMSDVKAAAMLQKLADAPHMPEHARRAIVSFLEESEEEEAGAPEANKFRSKSGGVADMMAAMDVRLKKQLKDLDTEEAEDKHSSLSVLQGLEAEISKITDARGRRAANMKEKEEAAANARAELASTTAARDADAEYLADLKVECEEKTMAFESRQKLRAEELEAIDEAMEIVASTSESGDKHLPGLVQKAALAQLRSVNARPVQLSVAAYLTKQGKKINSNMLAALALQVSADPFAKVKKLIEGMIEKLFDEATGEAGRRASATQ